MHKQIQQDCGVLSIPKVERQLLQNQLDSSMQRYLQWLSTNWTEYFAEEQPSRHPLLSGHQVHPGGHRPPGLRTGINTYGKTVCGLKSGKMRQHRLRSQEVEHDFEHQVRSCRHQHMTAVWKFLFVQTSTTEKPELFICRCLFFWISRPDSGNCPERDGPCRKYTWPDAHTHIFLVERVTFYSCALCMAQDILGWKESASSFCVHFHLVP